MSHLVNKIKKLVQYSSDLHLERGFKRKIAASRPNLILAGDIGYPSTQEYKNFLYDVSYNFDKVFILSGNHEYDLCKNNLSEVDDQINNICSSKNNLIYLQKKSFLLCKKDNICITGCTLWSKFPKNKTKYHNDHTKWLTDTIKNEDDKNHLIVTHHCPLFECIDESRVKKFLPDYFASDQSEILKYNNVIGWIFGHSHLNMELNINNKLVTCNQYGYLARPIYKYKK